MIPKQQWSRWVFLLMTLLMIWDKTVIFSQLWGNDLIEEVNTVEIEGWDANIESFFITHLRFFARKIVHNGSGVYKQSKNLHIL